MTTLQELIDDTRDHLMTGQPDRLNVLHANIDNSVDALQMRYELFGVEPRTRFSIGLEEFMVVSKTSSAPEASVTVIRGLNGSTKAAHSAGDLIYIMPQFSDYRIFRQLNKCLQGLDGDGLFRIKNVDFTYIPAQAGYNITASDLLDIWRVRYKIPGPGKEWPILLPQEYQLDQHADTTDFPGGKQLLLHVPGYPGQTVRVSYKARFSTLTNLNDDVEVVSGLHASAHDIPPLGAALRLLAGREIKRSFLDQQPEPRRQEEVPPGSAAQSITPIARLFYEAVDREVLVLHRRYPMQV